MRWTCRTTGAARRGARESRVHRLLVVAPDAREQDLLLAGLRKRLGKDVMLIVLDDNTSKA
jgi:hypothetical protein